MHTISVNFRCFV